jgi:hypothetical protein
MMTNEKVAAMTATDKIKEAMTRSLPHIPGSARDIVESLLKPEMLAIVAGTIIVWGGSHLFGVGEIVDIILLVIGAATLGLSVFGGASELMRFTETATSARTDADLERAGRHFANAVALLGISTIQALLLRGQGKVIIKRGVPKVYPRLNPGPPPNAGTPPRVIYVKSLPGNIAGETTMYGDITISLNQSLTEQKITLFHEIVHRFFSPRTGPFVKLRAELHLSAYSRSALLLYLEEALAEGYGQLRVNGIVQALSAFRFPLKGGYVTVSRLYFEGTQIGTIILGSEIFIVCVSYGTMPKSQ